MDLTGRAKRWNAIARIILGAGLSEPCLTKVRLRGRIVATMGFWDREALEAQAYVAPSLFDAFSGAKLR